MEQVFIAGVGKGVGSKVGSGVGAGVGMGVGSGVGSRVGAGVGFAVRLPVGLRLDSKAAGGVNRVVTSSPALGGIGNVQCTTASSDNAVQFSTPVKHLPSLTQNPSSSIAPFVHGPPSTNDPRASSR